MRGGLYLDNASTSWDLIGLYELNLFIENGLGYYGNGLYGFEDISLGIKGNDLPVLTHQVVAGIATPDFWVGSLPLSPWPFNFTDLNTPKESLLTTLKQKGAIETLSWGYTAGAAAHSPSLPGSLTLGGYDESQFVPSNIAFPLGSDISRDILVPVNSIQVSGNRTAMNETQYFFLDSLVPDLWLPDEACDAFEEAFSLTADKTTGRYIVSQSQRNELLKRNLSVTFTVGPGRDIFSNKTTRTLDIVMPYFAFDLEISAPLVKEPAHYFPLRRASRNSTQYTLGRAFFQAAYLVVDYERRNFSVSQASWPNPGVREELVAILPEESSPHDKGRRTVRSKIIAVVVTCCVVTILLLLSTWIWVRLRHKRLSDRVRAAKDACDAARPSMNTHVSELQDSPSARTSGTTLGHGHEAVLEVDAVGTAIQEAAGAQVFEIGVCKGKE